MKKDGFELLTTILFGLFATSLMAFVVAAIIFLPASCSDTSSLGIREGAISFQIPSKPAYDLENVTSAPDDDTISTWQRNDELLATIRLSYRNKGDVAYTIHTTLTYDEKGVWQLNREKSLIRHTDSGILIDSIGTNKQMRLFGTDAQGNVTLRLPLSMRGAPNARIDAGLCYAPGMEWKAKSGEEGRNYIIRQRKPGMTPAGTECWMIDSLQNADELSHKIELGVDTTEIGKHFNLDFSHGAFAAQGCRLRVYTGRAGDQIKLFAPRFVGITESVAITNDSVDRHAPGNLYVTTTDTTGNAYFYGYTTAAVKTDRDDRFIVSVDGIVTAANPASCSVVALSRGADMKLPFDESTREINVDIDASHVVARALAPTDFHATNYQAEEGYLGLKNALVTSTPVVKNTYYWRIAGLSGGEDEKNQAMIRAIYMAMDELYLINRNVRINLLLSDVEKLPKDAFRYCYVLLTVSAPQVLEVGREAFNSCKSLVSVDMPKVNTLEDDAFAECVQLRKIDMSRLTFVGNGTFFGCEKLAEIYLPELRTASGFAFAGCHGFTSVMLPQLSNLGTGAFFYCYNLKNITLPKVTALGKVAFCFNKQLANANLPQATAVNDEVFLGCTRLTAVRFSDFITAFGARVFNTDDYEDGFTANIKLALNVWQTQPDSTGQRVIFGKEQAFAGYTFGEIVEANP